MSTTTTTTPIPASMRMALDVERDLREQQVGVYFVMPRVVRRVLQNELDITSPWQSPPHRKCCVISRDRLLWVVARDELGVDANARLPEQIILIAQPEEEKLATMTRQELQRHYWRLMFHARIDYLMGIRTKSDQMSAAQLRQQIDRLGQTAFDEIRSVLRAEQMLVRPDDDRNIYAEFVAVYHELSAFAPRLIPLYFPSLPSAEQVRDVIGSECDVADLLNATRPSDLDVDQAETNEGPGGEPSGSAIPVPEVRRVSKWKHASYVRRAERLSARGNNVRAALSLQAAYEVSPPEEVDATRARCQQEILTLVNRLQQALELGDAAALPWLQMCERLLPGAGRGFWNASARLLYDLQNVCFDFEHETYKVDLLRWALSFGKTPLKRPLSNQRLVLMSKHLRAASLRVPSIQIDARTRRELSELLHEAADAAEHLLRSRIEPLIDQALQSAGFRTTGVVERVSLKKMVHELADSVVDRGFITLGTLRDTVSRNQLKMPDLTGQQEFFSGDPLLRADQLLAGTLDGVYPRGPIYLRWLQKVTSLAYGTLAGRFLTRYFALPFGLAFLLLKTADVAVEHLPFVHKAAAAAADGNSASVVSFPLDAEEAVTRGMVAAAAGPIHAHAHAHHVDVLYSHKTMFLLGLIIFSLMHFPRFRTRVNRFLKTSWIVSKFIIIDIPVTILHWRIVEWLFKSFPMMLFRRFVLTPLMFTGFFWLLLPKLGFYDRFDFLWWGLAILLASYLVLNSRVGRDTEELAREFFSRTWYRIRVHLVMGLFTLIIDIFHALMDGLERVLYAVDEWLRFRSGESNLTLGLKAIIGLIWSFIHGVIRFCVTLLIEPQVNPIKHFPVVTVSHKIVIGTLTVPIATLLQGFFEKPATAYTVTALILTSIPGIFGFLAWELKENWKLYKANRSPSLKPVPIGEHGETLLRLLCPGFHSGTIPRLYAKLRRAARRNTGPATENKQAKIVARLEHESTAVKHFFERELIALLRESRTFRLFPISISEVVLTTNRIQIDIQNDAFPGEQLQLEFAEQSSWLIAVIRHPGWLEQLEPDEVDIIKAALTGIYKLAAVDLVREQIEKQLGAVPAQNVNGKFGSGRTLLYDISDPGLVIWPSSSYEVEVHYPLDEEPISHPRPRTLARTSGLPPLPITSLVFHNHDVQWNVWRQFWDNEQNIPAHSTSRFPFKW